MTESVNYKISGNLLRAQEGLDRLIASGKKNVEVDFSECNFVSVSGLEWLEEMLLRAASCQAQVTFVGMPPALYKVFKVARIASILNACGSPSTNTHGPAC